MSSPLQTIRTAYNEIFMYEPDNALLPDFVMSTCLAAFHPLMNTPVWVYVIGPPSSGKTECVRALWQYAQCEFISTPTPNFLTSGYRDKDTGGEDPSLILKLNNRILIIKDISALANQSPGTVNKILGEMRDAFDGFTVKASGTVGSVEYIANFGVVILATPWVDLFQEEHQQLGERFLSFRTYRLPVTIEDRIKIAMRASQMDSLKNQWQAKLHDIVVGNLEKVRNKVQKDRILPKVSKEDEQLVCGLATLLCLTRTVPLRSGATDAELPSRVGIQLKNLGMSHALLDGRDEWNDDDSNLLRRVVVDSLPTKQRRPLQVLFSRGKHRPSMTSDRLGQLCHIPNDEKNNEMQKILRQFLYTGVVEMDEDSYRISKPLYQLMLDTGLLVGNHMPMRKEN